MSLHCTSKNAEERIFDEYLRKAKEVAGEADYVLVSRRIHARLYPSGGYHTASRDFIDADGIITMFTRRIQDNKQEQ